ncbi:response regulator [Acidithiobacillus montserratensis]|uniref:Response regulator n=1 Tax=Acidithiobacillus montserratensis TaxID=2729135 RepID=A0ACD5HH57_9PROT|nr:response regulator [Acidithiobacillus montserratensis]MBN2679526.1 response regulator [Acidithiobacillaceae bacterium]MBU2746812.1 response regulator [Acidithiobacillus montserratensis]
MTNNTSHSDSILVRSLGMDNRKEAVFRMAFKMHTRRQYHLLESSDDRIPHLTIVDIDGPQGIEIARKLHQEEPGQRILVTSVAPPENGLFPLLLKPVRMETLFPALESLLLDTPKAPEKTPADTNVKAIRPDVTVPPMSVPILETVPAPTPPVVHVIPAKPVPVLRPEEVQYFNSSEGLLGLLQIAQRDQASTIIADQNQQRIVRIDAMTDQATILVDDEQLQHICRTSSVKLLMRAPRDDDFGNSNVARHMSLQSLLWQAGAWTANGRLNQKLQINAPVQLKQWPNLTRLPMLPDALRLAAFLARSPASPALTIKMLRVEVPDLFNFLAAADALELLRYNTPENPVNVVRVAQHSTPADTEVPAAKRSFLGRLLKRIAGI